MSTKTKKIQEMVLNHIKYHTGLEFSVCEMSPRIYKWNQSRYYFNITTEESLNFQSQTMRKLERMANESNIVNSIEENGYASIAIVLEEGVY